MGWLSTKSPRSSWSKLILGEKMPDKNDPQYAERYEKEVATGRKFARWLRIDKAAACVQRFALRSPKLFLTIVFGIVLGCFALNVYRFVMVCNRPQGEPQTSVVQKQEQLLRQVREKPDVPDVSDESDISELSNSASSDTVKTTIIQGDNDTERDSTED